MKLPGIALFLVVAASAPCLASLADSLNSKELNQIKEGQQIMITEDVKDKPWPRVSVYQVVNASPEEVMAVFFDYNNACNFIPNVKKSEISKQINACSQEVTYSVDVPILPDEIYTMRNSLSSTPKGYKIGWTLLDASTMKAADGNFEVEPLDGRSLVRYQNLVDPGSKLAGMLKGFACQQIQTTVSAISKEIEGQKSDQPAKLQKKVLKLEEAVAK